MDCIRKHNNKCGNKDACPFQTFLERAIHCSRFVPDDYDPSVKTSMMEKEAAWKDVKAKGDAIIAGGGVEILEDNPTYVEALVMSGVVDGQFPVYDGGPYRVILSKRSWENKNNVGGWIQGYLCECKWGEYNSGEPGPGFQGRFCSHAYAAMVVADVRARRDFMNDRTASMKTLGYCDKCGEYEQVWIESGLCDRCEGEMAFTALAKSMFGNGEQAKTAEETLADIDEGFIERISNELEVEQRGDVSIARWNGYQAIFNEPKMASEVQRDDAMNCYVYIDDNGEALFNIFEPDQFNPYWVVDYGGDEIIGTSLEDCKAICDDIVGKTASKVATNYSIGNVWGLFKDLRDEIGWNELSNALSQYVDEFVVGMSEDELAEIAMGDTNGSPSKDKIEQFANILNVIAAQYGLDGLDERWASKVAYEVGDTFAGDDGWMVAVTDVRFEGYDDEFKEYECIDQNGEMITLTDTDLDYMEKVGSKKEATRLFTYAEMQELEDEVKGKPNLNNADRLKDPDSCMFY